MEKQEFVFEIAADSDEDRIWRQNSRPLLTGISENVLHICHYGFTEMLNNAIEHSEGKQIRIVTDCTEDTIELAIRDDGIGIFKKIKDKLNLEDERHAILELSKGKLTTDPDRHSGEGIFFTSRSFDVFFIRSLNLKFIHRNNQEYDWLIEDKAHKAGTVVMMVIHKNSQKTLKSVFDTYSDDNFGFTKTHVPVFLAQYGNDKLISRSQAKRVLARVDRFQEVLLDFSGVEMIGQAFADQIFRVFRNEHPDINLVRINTNDDVEKMVHRVSNSNDGFLIREDIGRAEMIS